MFVNSTPQRRTNTPGTHFNPHRFGPYPNCLKRQEKLDTTDPDPTTHKREAKRAAKLSALRTMLFIILPARCRGYKPVPADIAAEDTKPTPSTSSWDAFLDEIKTLILARVFKFPSAITFRDATALHHPAPFPDIRALLSVSQFFRAEGLRQLFQANTFRLPCISDAMRSGTNSGFAVDPEDPSVRRGTLLPSLAAVRRERSDI
ncbi:hypothetical protein LTS18_010128 [Coniosporium uncinatum]|uniref:Uncharacterized protein n=1 Tax=Coniosporium uncinatum TaxID=93489 RepID=A0ACC3D016_9PEZI|nr:hypothetical protein LTS18_010128 [Coniosporium uncinatum]